MKSSKAFEFIDDEANFSAECVDSAISQSKAPILTKDPKACDKNIVIPSNTGVLKEVSEKDSSHPDNYHHFNKIVCVRKDSSLAAEIMLIDEEEIRKSYSSPILEAEFQKSKSFSERISCSSSISCIAPVLGILFCLIESMLRSISGMLFFTTKSFSGFQFASFYLFMQFFYGLNILVFNSEPILPKDKAALRPLFFRCLVGSIGALCYMSSLKMAPVGDAIAVASTAPVFVSILARIFLKEKIRLFDALLFAVSSIGVFIIVRPTFIFGADPLSKRYPHHSLGLVYGLFGALSISVVIVCLRMLRSLAFSTILINFSFWGFAVTSIVCFATHSYSLPSCDNERYLFIALTFMNFCGQVFMYMALQLENAGIIAAVKSSSILFSFILQILVLKDTPPSTSWIGALLIMLSIIAFGLRRWIIHRIKMKRKQKRERMLKNSLNLGTSEETNVEKM